MSSAAPYIGSKITLVTSSDLRYEGVLININTAQSTVTLRDVRMTGTERPGQFVMPTNEVYDYIVFNGKDIKDLTVSEPAGFSARQDPAVVAVNVPPSLLSTTAEAYRGYVPPQNAGRQYHQQPNNRRYDNGRRMQQGGNNGRGAHGGIVGELTAQPNNSLKQEVADAFDFEQANTKFNKDEKDTPAVDAPAAYDKTTSFYDNISCEALSRRQGTTTRVDREKQREVDSQTFGMAAAALSSRYPRRPFKRNNGPNNRNNYRVNNYMAHVTY